MILAVNEAISALNASATASPTATVTMSPRMRKFLNPVNTLRALPSRPRRLRAVRCGGSESPGRGCRRYRSRPRQRTVRSRPRQRTARRAGRPAAHRPRAADRAQRAMITTRYRGGAKYYITKGFAIPALAEVAGQIAIFQAG